MLTSKYTIRTSNTVTLSNRVRAKRVSTAVFGYRSILQRNGLPKLCERAGRPLYLRFAQTETLHLSNAKGAFCSRFGCCRRTTRQIGVAQRKRGTFHYVLPAKWCRPQVPRHTSSLLRRNVPVTAPFVLTPSIVDAELGPMLTTEFSEPALISASTCTTNTHNSFTSVHEAREAFNSLAEEARPQIQLQTCQEVT